MAFTYTGENVQETPVYKVPPVGDYNVLITKGEEKISKSGKDMIVLTCKIQHPEYHNEIFDYIVAGDYAQQRIFNILKSCGVTPVKGMNITAKTFENRSGKVLIKHEEYNGGTQLRIHKWRAAASAPVDAPAEPAKSGVDPDDIPF